MKTDGSIGWEIGFYYLGPGWSSVIFFTVNKKPYLFLSNKSRGHNNIYKIENNGKLGSLIITHSWNSDWNYARFFYIDEDTYLFFLMEEYSNASVFRMNPDATIGIKCDTYKWFSKFNHARFYKLNDITYLFLFDADSGDINVYYIYPWGSIGNRISTKNIGPGWKWVEDYNIAGNNYLFFLHNSGKHYVYRIDPDGLDNGKIIYGAYEPEINNNGFVRFEWGFPGDMGACVAGYLWKPGWSYVKHYTVGKNHYMLFYHSDDNILRIHSLITAGYTRYLNSDGDPDFTGNPRKYTF